MQTVLALTPGAVRLGELLSQYPQYDIYFISSAVENSPNSRHLPVVSSPEEYEEVHLNLTKISKNSHEEVLLIVCGGSLESAAALNVLEAFKDKRISVLYVVPDRSFLSKIETLNERVVYHVLQEYARSGVFEKIYLVDNVSIEGILKDKLHVKNYYPLINETIITTFHTINVFMHTKAIFEKASALSPASRITTFGIGELGSQEKDFFPLKNSQEKEYYFAITEAGIENPETLERVKKYVQEATQGLRANFFIHATEYEKDFVYYTTFSSQIQNIS